MQMLLVSLLSCAHSLNRMSLSFRFLAPQTFRFFTRPFGRINTQQSAFTTSAAIMAQEYKIKGLSALDLKSGEKREVEVEGIENGKVLLAKVGNTTHAMSSNCTHYGAPLKLGVLTPEGRLTCAWHGGNSSIQTSLFDTDLCRSMFQRRYRRRRRCTSFGSSREVRSL